MYTEPLIRNVKRRTGWHCSSYFKKYGYSGREYYRKNFRPTVNSGNCMKMQNRPFKVQQIAALWLKKGGQVQVSSIKVVKEMLI